MSKYIFTVTLIIFAFSFCTPKKNFDEVSGVTVKCKYPAMAQYGETPQSILKTLQARIKLMAEDINCRVEYNHEDSIFTIELPLDSIDVPLFFSVSNVGFYNVIANEEISSTARYSPILDSLIKHRELSSTNSSITLYTASIEDKTIIDSLLEDDFSKQGFPKSLIPTWGLPYKENNTSEKDQNKYYTNLHMIKKSDQNMELEQYLQNITFTQKSENGYNYYNSIDIQLNQQGAKKFERLTELNKGKPLAIILNNQLLSAPYVNTKIEGGAISISGVGNHSYNKLITISPEKTIYSVLKTPKIKTAVVLLEVKKNSRYQQRESPDKNS